MKASSMKYLPLALAAFLMPTFFHTAAEAGTKSTFLYSLSNFNGKFPFSEVRVRTDRTRDEVYVIDRGIVRIFNNVGMEEFWFGDDPELGTIYDLAVDENGDIFLLSFDFSDPAGRKCFVIRCNYRGEIKEKFPISGLPPEFFPFYPDTLMYRDGNCYLAGTGRGLAIATDKKGVFQRGYDFLKILKIPEKERADKELSGFSIDKSGNMLFTIPVLFKAYVVSPEGNMEASFGKPGSAPGMFGVVGGIAADDLGNYFVVERLRSVVMVFDKEFRFLHEFGYRGAKPANLIRPSDLALGNTGKLYVNQMRDRGVSVFSVTSD